MLKNIAIVAHVDHGKTTLMDGLLSQSGILNGKDEQVDRVLDSGELERERGITITAKNCSIDWKGTKINLLDTPGHADFGGEVERSLMMVDSILLLVDASEGPLPQTRFVLQKAMERKLKIAVVINKVDRADQRIDEVQTEVEDLLLELATLGGYDDFDFDIPFIYCSAKEGWACPELPLTKEKGLIPILDCFISDFFPTPKTGKGDDLQILISNLAYSPYLGPLAIGRIERGSITRLQQVSLCGKNESIKNHKISSVQVYGGLALQAVESAKAGEIVVVAGIDHPHIGDTISSPDVIAPLPRIEVDPPTVAVNVSVNTSPMSSQEGEYLTSRKLEEFLGNICKTNVALKYSETSDPKVFILKGRGELQLAICFEELRRQGFEFMVSRPEVLTIINESGIKEEPFEMVTFDIPAIYTGTVTEKMSTRKGKMESMTPLGEGRTRMDFSIPSRGLIGYRSVFLTDTKGEGLMSSYLLGYQKYSGDMLARSCGALISDRTGKSTPYALFNLLSSGKQFIKPGERVYEGMIIGEHTRTNDSNVNAVREKHLSSVRTAGKDVNIILPPIRERTLDWALDWIDEDEWVEVTPKNIRIRKKILPANQRSVIRR